MKSHFTVRIASSVLAIGFLFACGPLNDGSQLNPSADPSSANGAPVPYPNFKSSDYHGMKNFAQLINSYPQGKGVPTAWAGYWWPYTKNGIATPEFAGLTEPSSRGAPSYGSPAGKYDAARGRTTHAQEWEVQLHGTKDPKVQAWWGHCNGWCAASALLPEPRSAATVNGITFGVADIKALLSEAGGSVNADYFGERIDYGDQNSPKYWDVVPDQYFLALTNYMGRLKNTVLIDRHTGNEVWNQPLAGYRFEYPTREDYLGNSPDAPDVYRIMITSTLWWMEDNVSPNVQSHAFNFEPEDPEGIITNRTLRMEVWLDGPVVFDSNGRITSSGDVIVTRKDDLVSGGAWRMDTGYDVNAWPDYMWIPYGFIPPNESQDYANPHVDIEWVKKHLLVPGGVDDTSVDPATITPAPMPSGVAPWPVNPGTPWPGTGTTSPMPWNPMPWNPWPGYPVRPGPTEPTGPTNPSGPGRT